jgi:hypothetical protein
MTVVAIHRGSRNGNISDTQTLDRPPKKAKSMVAPLALVVGFIAVAVSVVALTRSSHDSHLPKSATPAPTHPACQTEIDGAAGFVGSVRSQGRGAYESEPVNITGNGTYLLAFGPLTRADASRLPGRGIPSGIGVSFPANSTFHASPDLSHLERFEVNGASLFRIPLIVTDVVQPCAGLRAWVQF